MVNDANSLAAQGHQLPPILSTLFLCSVVPDPSVEAAELGKFIKRSFNRSGPGGSGSLGRRIGLTILSEQSPFFLSVIFPPLPFLKRVRITLQRSSMQALRTREPQGKEYDGSALNVFLLEVSYLIFPLLLGKMPTSYCKEERQFV